MRQLRMLVAYWRLRSLWRTLVAEAPAVILPVPVRWQSALFEPETLDLLLYRRVIEILDAWRQLDGIREMHEAATAAPRRAIGGTGAYRQWLTVGAARPTFDSCLGCTSFAGIAAAAGLFPGGCLTDWR
jgi:hypothetical protein